MGGGTVGGRPREAGQVDLGALLAKGLDRSSPVPLYHQLAELIRAAITDGRLPPGSRLENEVALAERLGLSRPTMRQALQELVDRGMLVRRRGIGTQVLHPHVSRSMALTSLHDDLSQGGQAPGTQVLEHRTAPASAELAEALGVATGTEVTTVRRLRTVGGEPLAIMVNHLPARLAPPPEQLATEGLYAWLREQGVHLRVARQRVGARLATATEARLLHERPRAALVTMQRTAYDDAGEVVEVGDHVYRASMYHFETTLVER